MKRVFLGGTCVDSTWRSEIKPLLEKAGLSYFDPVLPNPEDWDDAAKEKEKEERENCDFCVYVITPKMKGVYSIAEAVDDSNKRSEKIIFIVLKEDDDFTFYDDELSSLESVGDLIVNNGGFYANNLEAAVLFMYQSQNISIENINSNWPWKQTI